MKAMKKVLALGLALAMVVTAVPVTSAEAATAKLTAGKTVSKTYYAGKTHTLKLSGVTASKVKSTTWSKNGSEAVKLSSKTKTSATIKAVKAGTAKVTAKVTMKSGAKKTYTCKVTVKKPVVTVPGTATVNVGETTTLATTKKPASATVSYKSSNTDVATVDAQGVVTGVAAGEATITATLKCGTVTKTAKTVVTVEESFGISDLKATTASTLVATLAGTLSEEAKVEVTKTGLTTPVSGEVKVEGTTVTFSTTANLTAGTYTMTVTDGEKTDSKSVEVKDEYVAEIVITSTQALTKSNDKKVAYIYYDVLNQYGESIRLSTSVEWSSSAKNITGEKSTGKLTVTSDSEFVYGNQIYVTGVYTKTGVSVNKAVPVGMEQSLDSVEAIGFVDKNKPTVKLEALPTDFSKDTYYMIYEIRDQDNNLLDAANDNIAQSKVTFISDNILLLKVDTDHEKVFTIDGVEYSAVAVQPGQYVDKGGEVNITAISNKTGNKSNKNFVIGSNVLLQSIVLTGPSDVVADGDKDVALAYTAKDTNGNSITNYESIVRSTNTLNLSVSEGSLTVKEENDGTAGIYWSDKEAYDAWGESESEDEVDRTVAITTVVVGGESNNYLLSVSDKRRPVAIKSISSVNSGANAIVVEDTQKIDFSDKDHVLYLDQYGKDMKADEAAAFFTYSYNHGFGKGTDYTYGVKVDVAGANSLSVASDCEFYEGNYTLDLTGADTNGVIMSDTVKFSIAQIKKTDVTDHVADDAYWEVAGKVKSLTFDVVPVKELSGIAFGSVGLQKLETDMEKYNNGAEMLADANSGVTDINAAIGDNTEIDNGFAVKVVGKYKGNDLNVPADYYTIDETNVEVDTGKITKVKAAAGLKWSDLYDSNNARMTRKNATVTIKADVFNDTDKTQANSTIKLAVKLSDEARTATTLVIREGEAATKNATNTSKAIEDWFAEDDKDASNGVYVLDQYGETMQATYTYTVSDLAEASTEFTHLADSLKVGANGTDTASLSKAEIGDSFKLTITGAVNGNEVSASIVITLGADKNATINDQNKPDENLRKNYLNYDR